MHTVKTRRGRLIPLILAAAAAVTGCRWFKSTSTQVKNDTQPSGSTYGGEKVCAAVRGNGHYLMAHFGALARITEHYGPMHALAGGSSATVTMFLYESMAKNPLVSAATGRDRDLRLALLLKSMLGYLGVLSETPEAKGIFFLIDFAQKAREQGILTMPPEQSQLAAQKLQELLADPWMAELVNPNVLAMLQDRDTLGYKSFEYKVQEVKAAADSILAFKAEDQKIFFRQGIISFEGLANALGRMANFYAGYEPTDKALMTDFVEQCSKEEVSAGKAWPELAAVVTPKGRCGELFAKAVTETRCMMAVTEAARATPLVAEGEIPQTQAWQLARGTCGERLPAAVAKYRGLVAAGADPAAWPSRVREPMGGTVPAIVSTAVLEGEETLKLYEESLRRYRAAETPAFAVNFTNVRFGYWVPAALAPAVDQGMKAGAAADGKLRKYLNLGTGATWRDVLIASPAEPGLAPGVPLTATTMSVGGWSDLSPSQVLGSAGCDKVVYVTRRSAESRFLISPEPVDPSSRPPRGVAEQLNITEADRLAIYELANKDSGFARGIQAAQAVWCTDWNRFTDKQIGEMYMESYNAEMMSSDPFFTAGPRPYQRLGTPPVVGCTIP